MIGLIDTAVVYVPGATGNFDLVDNAALACRMALVTIQTAIGGPRAELTSARRLLWDPAYVMPETAQILVNGERWNALPGTFAAPRGPGGAVQYRRCELSRATT